MIDKLTRKNIFNIKPYLVGKPTEELAKEMGITKEIIRLNSNENPLGPSPKALEAMKEGLPKVNYYPDDNCYYLTQALTKKLGVDENELIISNGSAEILDFIAKCFVDPGDEVIMADQSFVIYPIVITIANGKIVSVPMKDFRHDLDAMAEAVTAKTKVIFIANPNNPTGTMNTAKEVERFMKKVPNSVLVVFDEAYYEYIKRPDYPKSMDYLKNGRTVLILRTFSKIYGLAGLRIGYGIGPSKIIDSLKRVHMTFNVNRIAQSAALAALEDKMHLAISVEINEVGKKYLSEEFRKLDLTFVPTEANFIFLPIGPKGKEIARKLVKEGLMVRFLPASDMKRSGLRVTIGTPEQNQKFITVLKRSL